MHKQATRLSTKAPVAAVPSPALSQVESRMGHSCNQLTHSLGQPRETNSTVFTTNISIATEYAPRCCSEWVASLKITRKQRPATCNNNSHTLLLNIHQERKQRRAAYNQLINSLKNKYEIKCMCGECNGPCETPDYKQQRETRMKCMQWSSRRISSTHTWAYLTAINISLIGWRSQPNNSNIRAFSQESENDLMNKTSRVHT